MRKVLEEIDFAAHKNKYKRKGFGPHKKKEVCTGRLSKTSVNGIEIRKVRKSSAIPFTLCFDDRWNFFLRDRLLTKRYSGH